LEEREEIILEDRKNNMPRQSTAAKNTVDGRRQKAEGRRSGISLAQKTLYKQPF